MTQEGIPNLTDCQPCVLVEVRVFSDEQCFLDFSWPVSLFISQHKVYGQLDVLQESAMLPVGQVKCDRLFLAGPNYSLCHHISWEQFFFLSWGSLAANISLSQPSHRNGLVNQVSSSELQCRLDFLGLYTHFCDSVPCNIQVTNPLKRGTVRILEWRSTNFTVVSKVLHSNYRSLNFIGPYHFWGISPRNLTSFTRPFLHNV